MSGLAFEKARSIGQNPSDRRGHPAQGDGHDEPGRSTPALLQRQPGMPSCPASDGSADVAIGDWDALFSAVEARLTSTVGELLGVLPETSASMSANRIRTSVLECVAALHQLHSTVTHELTHRQRLVFELTDTQTALLEARAEITCLRSAR